MRILDILDEIASDNSKDHKQEVLGKYTNLDAVCGLFKKVLKYAYDPNKTFYIKKVPAVTTDEHRGQVDLRYGLEMLKKIYKRKVRGADALDTLVHTLSLMHPEDEEVIRRIIAKDLRCGISANSINKVFPYHIPQTPYMGAKTFSEKHARKILAHGPAESDVKMDGRYVNISVVKNGEYSMVSRQGKNSYVPSLSLRSDANTVNHNLNFGDEYWCDYVLNGEVMMDGVSRYEANGIIASLVKIQENEDDGKDITKDLEKFKKKHGMSFQEAVDLVYVTVWDFLPLSVYSKGETWKVPRSERLARISKAIEGVSKIRLVEYRMVNTYEEAIAHFNEMVGRGEEGTILKSTTGYWEDKKPTHQIKMKLEMSVDMKIAGFNEGNGKYTGMLGSLICESEDGMVNADPYAFSDPLRKEIWDNQEKYLGTIVEVKCNGLSSNSAGEFSLLHPVFKTFRDDTTADNLIQIKENQDMVMGLS